MKKLRCVLLVVLAFFVGTKWEERSCVKDKMTELADFSTQLRNQEASLEKMGRKVKEAVAINEQLFAENAVLKARLKDCKPVPETKLVVPRKKKPRVSKPSCEKKVVSKPKEKALAPPKTVAPAQPVPQEETLEQKLSKACGGGPVKFAGGKWICVKDEVKVQAEPTPPVVLAPADDFFANAVDEEVGVQAQVWTPAYTAPVYVAYEPLSRLNCMTEPLWDSDGRFYPVGFQHSRRSNGMCRCGSKGCDLRWPR